MKIKDSSGREIGSDLIKIGLNKQKENQINTQRRL